MTVCQKKFTTTLPSILEELKVVLFESINSKLRYALFGVISSPLYRLLFGDVQPAKTKLTSINQRIADCLIKTSALGFSKYSGGK